MPSWNRDGDRALEDELRAARPAPRPEVTRSIADRVRPRDSAGKRRFGRLQLALAGGLTALVLTPVVASGVGGVPTFSKAGTNSARALHKNLAGSKKARNLRKASNRRIASRLRATRRRAPAALAPTGGGNSNSFLESIVQPRNDRAATAFQYKLPCGNVAIIQSNEASLTQGGNTATGGNATATGGAGGDASTGNIQTNNGAGGGDTSAMSGNATGGAGGNATANGGGAFAGNFAQQTLVNNATCP